MAYEKVIKIRSNKLNNFQSFLMDWKIFII